MRDYVPVFTANGTPVSHEPGVVRQRLYVHVPVPGSEIWGDARPAQVDDLIGGIRALSPEQQAYAATQLGLVPETIGERLEAAEDVLEALADARLSIKRLDEYRARFPEKRDD